MSLDSTCPIGVPLLPTGLRLTEWVKYVSGLHMPDNPKVFISYAGEDRYRFVQPFAERLRANGVDTWVAFWDMLPGDKLVNKIFDEGLEPSDAVIVVLSKYSVDKSWVREELHYAKVRQIEEKVRLIPVKIEPCDVPECVRTTLWEEISDLNHYDRQFERVLNSIYGQYQRPPLGPKPAYMRPDASTISGLAPIDALLFEALCRSTIESGFETVNQLGAVEQALNAQGVSTDQMLESHLILEGRGYLKLHSSLGSPHPHAVTVTPFGFDQFAHTAIPGYEDSVRDMALALIRSESEQMTNVRLAEELQQPRRIVDHILTVLELKGWAQVERSFGGGFELLAVTDVSPELRRMFQQ
jgi:hypothetical protein